MSKEKTLTAYNDQQLKSKCWYNKRNNQYYLLGKLNKKDSGGAYKFKDGKHATKNYVIWSNYLKRYVRKNNCVSLVVDAKGNMDYVDMDYQTNQNIYSTENEQFLPLVNEVDIEKFKFDVKTGVFYIGSQALVRRQLPSAPSRKVYDGYPSKVYNYADLPSSIKQSTIQQSSTPKASFPHDESIAENDGNLTFGIELETSKCLQPQKYLTEYGFIPVYDGSIQGNEMVSVPFQGLNGLRNIHGFCSKLQKYASVDHTCSLHVHQGKINVKDNKKFIASLHWLYVLLQGELSEMVPGYKKDIQVLKRNDKGNGKDYCKEIPSWNLRGKSVDERYDAICQWVNDFQKPSKQQLDSKQHSKHGQQKWYRIGRYYSLNFDNWFFSNSNTIEYRLHHGTVNPDRVINWLAITLAITNYAINHMDQILNEKIKYDLEDIVNDTYDTKYAAVLNSYIQERKNFFTDQKLRGDNGLKNAFKDEGIK